MGLGIALIEFVVIGIGGTTDRDVVVGDGSGLGNATERDSVFNMFQLYFLFSGEALFKKYWSLWMVN